MMSCVRSQQVLTAERSVISCIGTPQLTRLGLHLSHPVVTLFLSQRLLSAMPNFRWPELSNDLALAKEVMSLRPEKPCNWDAIATKLSALFSTNEKPVILKGIGCRERMDLLLKKFKDEDAKSLKRSGTEEDYSDKCKYGFPYSVPQEVEELDEDSTRYLYPQRHEEDKMIVPYNLEIPMVWGAGHNVQCVSRHGFEMYLAKYISKLEPTTKIELPLNAFLPERYLNTRVIGAIEALEVLMGFQQH